MMGQEENRILQVGSQRLARESAGQERILALLREDAEQQMLALAKRVPQGVAGQSAGLRSYDAGTQRGILPGKFAVTQRAGAYNPGLYAGINKTMTNPGTDFATPVGTPVAIPSGRWVIKEAGQGWNSGWGNSLVAMDEDSGETIRFSHLSGLNAIPGQRLLGGSVVGRTGNTGNTTGPHIDLTATDKSGKIIDILNSRWANELFGA